MKKQRPVKKKSTSSSKSTTTRPPAGRVIRTTDEASTTTRTSTTAKSSSAPKKRRRKRGKRRLKRQLRFFFQSCLFLGVVFTLLVVSYDFVEGYLAERTKHETLMSEQIIPIYDLQLVLNEDVTLNFFIEGETEDDESERLISVRFPKDNIELKKRSSVPYPYLKATCPKENRYCTLEEASNFTIYLKEEDLQSIQIP